MPEPFQRERALYTERTHILCFSSSADHKAYMVSNVFPEQMHVRLNLLQAPTAYPQRQALRTVQTPGEDLQRLGCSTSSRHKACSMGLERLRWRHAPGRSAKERRW
jgi:hypothetical protein